MPCRYDPGPEDYLRSERQKVEKLTKDLDKLTHENDQLREALLRLINDPNYKLPQAVVKKVKTNQVKHRKEDLKRLEKTFRDDIANGVTGITRGTVQTSIYEILGKIVAADPNEPLEPQLGFDPDEF